MKNIAKEVTQSRHRLITSHFPLIIYDRLAENDETSNMMDACPPILHS